MPSGLCPLTARQMSVGRTGAGQMSGGPTLVSAQETMRSREGSNGVWPRQPRIHTETTGRNNVLAYEKRHHSTLKQVDGTVVGQLLRRDRVEVRRPGILRAAETLGRRLQASGERSRRGWGEGRGTKRRGMSEA